MKTIKFERSGKELEVTGPDIDSEIEIILNKTVCFFLTKEQAKELGEFLINQTKK